MEDVERKLMAGLLSKGASFRLFVRGTIGPKELETLIKKLEIDKDILAVPDDGDAAADIFNLRGVAKMADLEEGQGYVGDKSTAVLVLDDADPRTPPGSATYDTVTFSVADPAIASFEQTVNKPLECAVTLLAEGSTEVLAEVDPGAGEPLHFAVPIEALVPQPGEATSGTFTIGAFVPV